MNKKFSFDHLTDTEFEEFCFELLKEMKFNKVSWRKGTGKSTSPADSGRDIEANFIIKEIDGEARTEKWFFECKQHTAGVSPTKIQGALAWASAKRPDKLVIICSNFLSNRCKDYIEEYERENKPFFKIKVWELKDLEDLAYGKIKLLNKYKLSNGMEFLDFMHPLHLKYVSKPTANTLNYFFDVLDKYDSKKREKFLEWAYAFFMKSSFKKSISGNETIGDLKNEHPDYITFKKYCYTLDESVAPFFLVKSIVNLMLEWIFQFGDKSQLDVVLKQNELLLEYMHKKSKSTKKDSNSYKGIIQLTEKIIEKLPEQTKEYYELYVDFCENVLARLMEEEVILRETLMSNNSFKL